LQKALTTEKIKQEATVKSAAPCFQTMPHLNDAGIKCI